MNCHIVNTASIEGLAPFPGTIAYVTSKHGVVGLSNRLRVEGADKNTLDTAAN